MNGVYFKRKIQEKIKNWHDNFDGRALLIKGARQIGKSYNILTYAKSNFDDIIELNFWKHPEYKNIFKGSLAVDNLIEQITALFPKTKLVPGKTLLFFDEIQDCDEARASLKFFSQDKRFHIIASGSVLGTSQQSFVPIGSERTIIMHSMDFEEFLWANGYKELDILNLKKYYDTHKQVPTSINDSMFEMLKKYIVVGGMPKVVEKYILTHDINIVSELQKDIMREYRDDISKYVGKKDSTKARDCFDSIPFQLAKDNKKFQFSTLSESKKRMSEYEYSLKWLSDSNLAYICYNIKSIDLPLASNIIKNSFKIYMEDIGLLVSSLGENTYSEILNNNLGIYKGAIYENLIVDILLKKDYDLFYLDEYKGYEIDFVYKNKDLTNLLEVKSSNNRAKSLGTFVEKYKSKYKINPLKLISGNVGTSKNYLTLPLWMTLFL